MSRAREGEPVGPQGAVRGLPIEAALEALGPLLNELWTQFAGLEVAGRREVRILFVSPRHEAGTTTLATCTALGLARHLGESVALVEQNLFTPAMASYLGLPETPGFTDVLDGRATPEEAIQSSVVEGLHVLSAGTPRAPRPGELASEGARELVLRAARGHRYTFLDGAPLLDHPALHPLLDRADAAVLVLRARGTKKAEAQRAARILEEFRLPLFGSILNRFRSDLPFGLRGPD